MKGKRAFLTAALILVLQLPASADWYVGGGGWGSSWWSPGGGAWGPGPGWGWNGGWSGFGPGWWGASPYYNYYNGVQDGVGAGLLLGELDRLIGVPAPSSSGSYSQVIAQINAAADTLAQKQAAQTAQLVTQSGAAQAVQSMQSYWQQHSRQTEIVNNGGRTRLGVSGFTEGLKILYIIDMEQNNVTVIVGTAQFQIRQSESASFTVPE